MNLNAIDLGATTQVVWDSQDPLSGTGTAYDVVTGLVGDLRHRDWFLVCADFEAYRGAQRAVADLWRNRDEWWRHAVLNTAGMGWFSADRTILDYAREIWGAQPLHATEGD